MIEPDEGLLAFASIIIDDWMFVNDIAIFAKAGSNNKNIRLIFPEKKKNNKCVKIFYPVTSEAYFALEQAIQKEFNKLK